MTDEHLQRSKPTPQTGSPSNPNRSAESERKSGVRPKPRRFTEAELIDFEYYFGPEVIQLTEYIRATTGTADIPPFKPLPDAVERAIIRHRRKVALAAIDKAELRRLQKINREHRNNRRRQGIPERWKAMPSSVQSRENPGDDATAAQAHQEGGS